MGIAAATNFGGDHFDQGMQPPKTPVPLRYSSMRTVDTSVGSTFGPYLGQSGISRRWPLTRICPELRGSTTSFRTTECHISPPNSLPLGQFFPFVATRTFCRLHPVDPASVESHTLPVAAALHSVVDIFKHMSVRGCQYFVSVLVRRMNDTGTNWMRRVGHQTHASCIGDSTLS